MINNEILSARIRFLRKSRGLRQEDVAAVLNQCRATYTQKDNGARPFTLNDIVDLARFFQVSTDELLMSDEPAFVAATEPPETTIASRVRSLRAKQGMTQKQFSEAVGLRRATYKNKEDNLQGRSFSVEELVAISQKFDVPLDWLILGKEKTNVSNAEEENQNG